jgi:hypothetical protein
MTSRPSLWTVALRWKYDAEIQFIEPIKGKLLLIPYDEYFDHKLSFWHIKHAET